MILPDESNQISSQEKSLNSNSLFLGFVNKRGRLERSSPVTKPLLPKQKMEMLLMGASLQDRMLRDFNEDFGEVSYAVVERKNLKFVSIPSDFGILFGILPTNTNHLSFIDVARTMLRNLEENFENKMYGVRNH